MTASGEVATMEPVQPVKEKKAKAPKVAKEKKPKSAKAAHPAHPPYFQMIKEALVALNEKSGSSPYAIAKHMEEKHKAVLPANFRKMLALQLKNSVVKEKLIKIKASYKLSEAGKKEKVVKPAIKADAEKKKRKIAEKPKTAASTRSKMVKKSETPKKAAKKVGMKKARKATPAKPKQPKSIKSPAKKARKATA